ncbi:HAMP domain-containing sensor histidine kinase [Marinobacter sp. JSM 1782161]|uniref:HAMP domain-containing sensor histidine kinase n=1 Tax=Marinobacter sp. JSM 1782161 TaxID=2685906 RepID=UPI001402B06A|nr:ATP-binding protein [Marinobacter sp. JSM 1782161]
MKPSPLFWKFFIAFWLAITLSFFVGAALFRFTDHNRPDPKTAERMMSIDHSRRVIEQDGIEVARPLLDWVTRPGGGSLALLDSDDRVIAGQRPDQFATVIPVTGPEGQRFRFVSADRLQHLGPPRPNDLVPVAIGAVVSVLFSLFLAWYLARPLILIRDGLRSIGGGQLSTRVRHLLGRRKDEIGELGDDFDRMASHLQKLIEEKRRLLHDISHELRSPLARLRVATGLLTQSRDPQPGMLERIEREAERLEGLIEEILTLSYLESGSDKPLTERVDVIELLNVIADDADFEASSKRCAVTLEAQGQFVTRVSGELLYRAFENVIRNAVKYTTEGTTVRISAAVDTGSEQLAVDIIDQGPGVPESMLDDIFLPFKRLDSQQTTEGVGLGLAIAQRAIAVHNGHISASQATGGGLHVTIHLPRWEDSGD